MLCHMVPVRGSSPVRNPKRRLVLQLWGSMWSGASGHWMASRVGCSETPSLHPGRSVVFGEMRHLGRRWFLGGFTLGLEAHLNKPHQYSPVPTPKPVLLWHGSPLLFTWSCVGGWATSDSIPLFSPWVGLQKLLVQSLSPWLRPGCCGTCAWRDRGLYQVSRVVASGTSFRETPPGPSPRGR